MPLSKKPIIEVKKLNVIYFPGKNNEVRALTDISLEIYPGEFIIFFGPSGCGKSTLLYSISGLERNIKGDIFVKGDNLRTLGGKKREAFHQKTIGMVFQAFYLIPSLSVLHNVVLPQMALNMSVADREKLGHTLLKQFGVFEQAKKLPTELSGGQQQRVAICRSVINNPDIILADEPVGNLDSKSSDEVLKLLRELNDIQKKTVILVTHDPSHIHHAHRVFFIRDGRINRVQVNSEQDRKQSPVMAVAHSSLSAELQEWAKTLAPELSGAGSLTDLLNSRQLLTEVLTGMTAKEMALLENSVQELLRGKSSPRRLFHLLHDESEKGGLHFAKAKAERWTKEIATLVAELRRLQSLTKHRPPSRGASQLAAEARELRRYVLRFRHPAIRKPARLLAIDRIIAERLSRKLDPVDFRKKLSLPLAKGGAAFGPASATTFAKKTESLILLIGEQPDPKKPTPPPNP